MLAPASRNGATQALLSAHGFDASMIAGLVNRGMATIAAETVRAAGKMIKVGKVRITDDGRRAIETKVDNRVLRVFSINSRKHLGAAAGKEILDRYNEFAMNYSDEPPSHIRVECAGIGLGRRTGSAPSVRRGFRPDLDDGAGGFLPGAPLGCLRMWDQDYIWCPGPSETIRRARAGAE
jgi:hypothetical protein